MQVTSLEIHSAPTIPPFLLSYRDTYSNNPYLVKAVIGLDASEIIAKYYGSGGGSGQKYYNLSITKRDVVIRIGLNPRYEQDETFSHLRDEMYKIISSTRTGLIQIRFKNGSEVVGVVSGTISKFEASHFSETPEIQLTVECKDPMLRALDPIDVDVLNHDPENTIVLDNSSTAPHGFKFAVKFLSNQPSFMFKDTTDDWEFNVDLTDLGGFFKDDVLYFSSEHNNKELYMVRGSTTIQLADKIVPGSMWPIIFPGVNNIICSPGLAWVYLTHYPTYWGV